MIPAIVAALGRAGAAGAVRGAAGSAASGAGSQLVYNAANQTITKVATPPPLPKQGGGGMMDKLMDSVGGGSFLGSMAGSAVGDLFSKLNETMHKITHPLETFRDGLGKLKKTLTEIPATILAVKDVIVSTAQAWTEALAAPITTVKELGAAIAPFTSLSNPGAMKMLNFRVENAMATIGNILQPVLDALTRSAEKMGDLFARLKPALAPAMQAVSELIDFIATRFADIAEFVAPGIQMISTLFLGMVRVFEMVQKPITAVIRGLTALRNILYDFLGIPRAFDKNAKSDFAVKEPRYAGAEDIFREQAKNALMASMGPGGEKKDVPTLIESLIQWLKDNLTPEKIATAIASKTLPVKIVQAVKNEVKEQIKDTPIETGGRLGAFGLIGHAF